MGFEPGAVGQSDGFQRGHDLPLSQGMPGQAGGHGDVLGSGQGGDEVVVLEDESHVAGAEGSTLGRRHGSNHRAQEADLAAGGLVQSRHGVQQRRLTRSRGPHHRGETALRQVGINPVQGNHLGILAPRDVVDAGQCPHRDRRAAGSIGVDDLLRCP